MGVLRTIVAHDNIAVDRCKPVSGSATLTNTTDVASVTRRRGEPKLEGTFQSGLILVGDRVTGTGIAAGSRVVSVGNDYVLMDKAAASDGVGTVSFYAIGFIEAGWTVGFQLSGSGIAAAARITAIASETSLTMSAVATATDFTTVTQRSHITAAVAAITRPVPMAGAKMIAWVARSADTDAPGATVYQYSPDDGVNFRAADASFFGGAQHNFATGLANGGGMFVLGGRRATEDFYYLAGTHMRLSITGHATNQIDSVTVEAFVYGD